MEPKFPRLHHLDRALLRFCEWLPRCRQLSRHRRCYQGTDASPGRHHGSFLQLPGSFFFGTGVADTIGRGFVNTRIVTPCVILAGLLGAILWNLFTWYLKLPVSSSHALIGGYAGAALAKAGGDGLVLGKWVNTLAFIVVAPVLGLLLGYGFMVAVYWVFHRFSPSRMDRWFRHLQILSAALLSGAHGTNDAQKSMGIITAVLVAGGLQTNFHVPKWVIACCAAAMGMGTLSGGWRIVHTMGTRFTRLKPRSGFCAEAGAAISILLATWLGLPFPQLMLSPAQ